MSDESTIPTLKRPSPKNLAGANREGTWPEYLIHKIKDWALTSSKNDDRVKMFFETDYPEFIKRNSKRREQIRERMRAIRVIFTKSRTGLLEIKEAYTKLATNTGQITDLEGETDTDVIKLIDKVDDWELNADFKTLEDSVREKLIIGITETISLDKEVQSEFVDFTIDDEKSKILKKIGASPFDADTVPIVPKIVVPEVTKKWAKKPGNNFKEKSMLKKPCNHMQFLKWKTAQHSFWTDEFDGEIPDTAAARWNYCNYIMDNRWVSQIEGQVTQLTTWDEVLIY